jgi:hypothetical protein
MTDDLSPAGHAQAIDDARQRLLIFVHRCTARHVDNHRAEIEAALAAAA